jgi:SAM-dependent methyltransferase
MFDTSGAKRDPWLERWLPLLAERAVDRRVLELGCGQGRDTQILAEAGFHVAAIDLSATAIAQVQAAVSVSGSTFYIQDIRAPFPPAANGVGVIVASLSLHYFSWTETLMLAARIRQTLAPRGVLLCRLNSTRDHHFGASGHPEMEPHFFLVDGTPKRFFDRASVVSLFASGWRVLALDEVTIDRYGKPKVVWEAVLEKTTARDEPESEYPTEVPHV